MPVECPACPSCNSVEGVFPVSRIYIASITHPYDRNEIDRKIIQTVYGEDAGSSLRYRRFEPPQSNPQSPHPLHPDMAAAIAVVFILVWAGNVYAANRQVWTPPLWIGVGMGFLYLLVRGRLMANYRTKLAVQSNGWRSLADELAHWQRSYFCVQDEIFFEVDASAVRSSMRDDARALRQDGMPPFDWI